MLQTNTFLLKEVYGLLPVKKFENHYNIAQGVRCCIPQCNAFDLNFHFECMTNNPKLKT